MFIKKLKNKILKSLIVAGCTASAFSGLTAYASNGENIDAYVEVHNFGTFENNYYKPADAAAGTSAAIMHKCTIDGCGYEEESNLRPLRDYQPASRDFGYVKDVSKINWYNNIIAYIKNFDDPKYNTDSIKCQYYDKASKTWKDYSWSANAFGMINGYIVPGTEDAATVRKEIANNESRFVLPDGTYTNSFMIAVNSNPNNYSKPAVLTGMTDNREYIYTADEDIILSPNIVNHGNSQNYKITWYKSTDGGKTFETLCTGDTSKNQSLSYKLEAGTDNTYSQFKYRIENEAGYVESDSFETIVYEKYTNNNGELTVESTGNKNGKGNLMNNYTVGSRLEDKQPWSSLKNSVTSLKFNDKVLSIGNDSFKDFTKLTSVDLNKVTVVGERSLKNATSLKGITIPVTAKALQDDALQGDTALLDIRFLNPNTTISSVATTIPESKEEVNSNVVASNDNKALVKNQHSYPVIYGYSGKATDTDNGITASNSGSTAKTWADARNRAFIPLDAVDATTGKGYPLNWVYRAEGNNIVDITLSNADSEKLKETDLSVYIPKSIDGKKVIKIDRADASNILGCTADTENAPTINTLHIPETIQSISDNAFENLENIKTLFDYSRTNMAASPAFFGNDASTMWTYSTNSNFRNISKIAYTNVRLFDENGKLSGKTGDLTWEINLKDGSLTLSGLGNSADYDDPSTIPFGWAKDEITQIIIKPGVNGLGKNLYANLTKVNDIQNLSEVLTSIDETSFTNVGSAVSGTIKTKTYVNNLFYDRMNELDATINASMRFNFLTTSAGIGNGVQFTYDAGTNELSITGAGAPNTFADANNVPWRCVNDLITKATISKEVTGLSNNMFNGLTHLQTVYNYAKNQNINGGSDNLFDVIDRFPDSAVANKYFSVDVSEDISADEKLNEVVTQLKAKGVNVTTDDLVDIKDNIKSGTHLLRTDLQLSDIKKYITSIEDLTKEKQDVLDKYGLTEINVYAGADAETQKMLVLMQARGDNSKINLYEEDLENETLVPGTYFIENDSSTEDIVSILTGKKTDSTKTKHIVPVYTYGDSNQKFVDAVPQPESKGYKLENLYIAKGQAGDNLYWYLSLEGKLSFEGYGDMWDFETGKAPWYQYGAKIKELDYDQGMTSIGTFAFEDCNLLTESGAIPNTVTRVGVGAFKGCTDLYSFTIAKTMTDFESGVFAGCSNLRVLNIEDATKYSLNDGVLYNKDKEVLGYLRDTLYVDIDTKKVADTVSEFTIPDGTTKLGELSFYGIDSITKLNIPNSVTELKSKALAEMPNLKDIQNNCETKQRIATDILSNSGSNYNDTKFTVIWKANSDFSTIAAREGYLVRYFDETKVSKVTAVYTGAPVTIGNTYDLSDVVISILYTSGESKTINGSDTHVTMSGLLVDKIGTDNKFTATYDDGYGQVYTTSEFSVEGVNKVIAADFRYNGTAVWYGEQFDPGNVNVILTYADGTYKTIKGDATYTADNKAVPYVTYNKLVIDKVGKDNEITAIYKDASNGPITGKFNVTGNNYLTAITANYRGEAVELAEGTKGINLDDLIVDLEWADNSVERVSGQDTRIEISSDYYVSGENIIYELTCLENNRHNLTASFSTKYLSNVSNVEFEYVGQPVTKGTKYSMADIELTLHMTDGTVKKVTGDSVTGLTADVDTVNTSDDVQPVNLTYEIAGSTFTGTVYIPGKIMAPIKLIVVKRPQKSVYEAGDTFDPTGMVVHCLFDNGDVEDVTDKISIDGGDVMSATTNRVTLVYYHTSSNTTVKTNMAINVNQNQKILTQSKSFKEQYEITKILFRSKMTEDETYGNEDEDDTTNGKWVDITPTGDKNIITPDASNVQAVLKAGYGFELKVYTRYRTDRAGEEFANFMKKSAWDEAYQRDPSISGAIKAELNSKWKYLNDVYPQYTPTANPDILYLQIENGNITDENGDPINTSLNAGQSGSQNFLVLEKTDISEDGNKIDEGNWYNSEKIFEIPERDVFNSGAKSRRIYVSRSAADPNAEYTDYQIKIISPAWYGYEPEPVFVENGTGSGFKYITSMKDDGTVDDDVLSRQKVWSNPGTPYLHVCAAFTIRVTPNDDIHTHILQ